MQYYVEVLKKYAVFKGRARRKEYWMFFLFNLIISIILNILTFLVPGAAKMVVSTIALLYGLAIIIPSLAVGARRLHDTNRSGWWLLIGLIPIIGTIVLIVFFAFDSHAGANQYGPSPKEGAAA